ncbi:2-C-methyl-D-erythritol 4-phosphate cytidylyltransferase [Roseivivax sp. CAU 1761]
MRLAVLIVAAGRGTRAGGPLPKQWQEIAGRTVAAWTLDCFAAFETCLVIHPDDAARAAELCLGRRAVRLVEGGATRAASVRAGLEALADDPPEAVLIHDVARPCLPPEVVDAVIAALAGAEAAAPALPVTDALWTAEAGRVTGALDREGLWRAQTPQGFRFDAILAAHRALPAEARPADDVAVARGAGIEVVITAGSEDNLKITSPADFRRAARILEA